MTCNRPTGVTLLILVKFRAVWWPVAGLKRLKTINPERTVIPGDLRRSTVPNLRQPQIRDDHARRSLQSAISPTL